MLLKELILTSLDSFSDFIVNGKVLNRENYLKLAYRTIKNFYLDIIDNKAVCVVELEEY